MYELARFNAVTDDGTVYLLIKFGSRRDASHLEGKGSIEGLSEFRTALGGRVNSKGNGVFEIVATGEIVRRV